MLATKGILDRIDALKITNQESRHLKARTRLIHALDVDDKARMFKIARLIEKYVDAIKISYPSVLRNGPGIISDLKEIVDVPILACFKVGDIPEISAEIMRAAVEAGADGVTVHGFAGSDTVRSCIDVAKQYDAEVYVVTEMSHPGGKQFMEQVGEQIATMARELQATGIVAPATRLGRIRTYRRIVGDNMIIMCPGVGAQGGEVGATIKEGADFEIVGRSIYNSQDPAAEAARIGSILKSIKPLC